MKLIRWVIAIILLPLIVQCFYIGFTFTFEWLISKTSNISDWLYVFIWIFLTFFLSFLVSLASVILPLLGVITNGSKSYVVIFGLYLTIMIGYWIYCAWSNNVTYLWELYKHSTYNRIFFTINLIVFLKMPSEINKSHDEISRFNNNY